MKNNRMKYDSTTVAYADAAEAVCDDFFAFLTGKTGWFNQVIKNPNNSKTDYKSVDTRFRTVTIELKNRNIKPYQFNDIMIEPSKYSTLTGSTTDKSWYICFFEDARTFWISDIKPELNNQIRIKKNVRITNKNLPDNYSYVADRYYISMTLGHLYQYDEIKDKYFKI